MMCMSKKLSVNGYQLKVKEIQFRRRFVEGVKTRCSLKPFKSLKPLSSEFLLVNGYSNPVDMVDQIFIFDSRVN